MAFFGLIGNDRQMASTTYAGKESASEKRERVEARRRERHHRSVVEADRKGWKWADEERERQEGRGGRRGWFS